MEHMRVFAVFLIVGSAILLENCVSEEPAPIPLTVGIVIEPEIDFGIDVVNRTAALTGESIPGDWSDTTYAKIKCNNAEGFTLSATMGNGGLLETSGSNNLTNPLYITLPGMESKEPLMSEVFKDYDAGDYSGDIVFNQGVVEGDLGGEYSGGVTIAFALNYPAV